LARPYLFWAPHESLAFSAEYQYERFDRSSTLNFGLKEAETHRVPLGFRFFHPSGLSFAWKATYFNQHGDFQRKTVNCCESGRSEFWLLDAAISYRLPNRYGTLMVGATNINNNRFNYQETDFNNPTLQQGRMFFARLNLSF
jgi:hypothetical protein